MKFPAKLWTPGCKLSFHYAHVKRDGHFLYISKATGNGLIGCYTTTDAEIYRQLKFMKGAAEVFARMPKGAGVFGELWLPGGEASDVKTAINNQDQRLRFEVFALSQHLAFKETTVNNMALSQVKTIVEDWGFHFVPFIELKGSERTDPRPLMQRLPEHCEGFVLKNANLVDWHKLKTRQTIDLIITGLTAGKGKYSDMLGALVCSTAEGYEVANVSGMTDTQRRSMSLESEKLVGKVVEVEYQSIGAGGRLRHPSFIRMRDDKRAEECLIDQDPALKQILTAGRLFQ